MVRGGKAFQKPALSNNELLNFLEAQGLAIPDRDQALRDLARIGYYRLKIYTRPFQPVKGTFQPGAEFQDIVGLYEFDRRLRLVALDGLERIEVALRSAIVEITSDVGGAHCFEDAAIFSEPDRIGKFKSLVADQLSRKTLPVLHYHQKYNDPDLPPIWCIVEVSTFGWISKTYTALNVDIKKRIAKRFGYNHRVLTSWFRSLASLRNLCAHHSRVWNAQMLVNEPMIAKDDRPHLASAKNTFYLRAFITMRLLTEISRSDAFEWSRRFKSVVRSTEQARLEEMGFPTDWLCHEIWSDHRSSSVWTALTKVTKNMLNVALPR